jgi:hypothetical protein
MFKIPHPLARLWIFVKPGKDRNLGIMPPAKI